jgi:hypothetical protein
MGSEESKNEAYENRCKDFIEYFKGETENLKLEKQNEDLIKKIKEEPKKKIVTFIKKLIQDEEKKKILEEMDKIFRNLINEYEKNHIEENENKKTFSENIDENEKNVINAIYISKIIDDEDLSIHDYAVELYDEKEVEKIEEGENENIDEVFKKYEKFNPTDEEINKKYDEICKENEIEPKNDSAQAEQNPQTNKNSSNDNNSSSGKNSTQTNENNSNIPQNSNNQNEIPQNSNNNQPDSLYKNTYNDSNVSDYYDIVFDIDSLENLKINGWKFEADQEGFDKYSKKKDVRNTVVSVIGNKNKGKSFILAKISRKKIPDGHNITTKGLSVIYPDYDEKNVIFLDTAGFEIPLCEDESVFKFETSNKEYLEKKKVNEKISVKDYISEEEYIDQIMKFTRDRQNTDYFLQKFIMNSADILLCIVNKLDLSDQKFLKRIQDENKDKKIFIIHNLKTISKIKDVENYINETLLKVLSFRLQKSLYTSTNDNKNSNTQNNVYYKQKFLNESNPHREVIHLFMAKDSSEAGNFYNDSTINFIIVQIIALTNNKTFDILEQVKKYLAENSEKFFNEGIDEKDLKITDCDGNKSLKYENKEKPFELKECYVDELGNTNFIQSNYKPYYRVYKANFKENEKKKTSKLIIDVEISGNVEDLDIKKVSQNKNNIITIKGKRMIGKKKKKNEQNENKTEENSNEKKKNIKKNIKEYKSSYFNEEPTPFNLRIFIPNEKCIIGDLFKEIDFEDEGLYRFIYNIQDISNTNVPIKPDVISSDSEEGGEISSD